MSTSTTCKYTLTDGNGTSNEATITVEVTEPPFVGEPTIAELFAQPFNSGSAFNRPIGTGATYSGLPFLGRTDGTINDSTVFSGQAALATAANPSRTFTSWTSAHNNIGMPFTTRIPNGFPSYDSTVSGDRAITVVEEDNGVGHDIYNTRISGSTYQAGLHRTFDLKGLGHGTTAGFANRIGNTASGAPLFAGTFRKFEFETPGLVIRHAHHMVAPRFGSHNTPFIINRRIQLPAVCTDGNAGSSNSDAAPCAMGELLAIRPDDLSAVHALIDGMSVSAASKETIKRYATAFAHYGIYIVDGGGQPGFRADAVLDGTMRSAFLTFMRTILWSYLYIVTNSVTGATATINSSNAISGSVGTLTYPAGGGTALAPNAAFDSEPTIAELFAVPFNKNSAQHRPIGTGASYSNPNASAADGGAPLFAQWVGSGNVNDNRFGHFVTRTSPTGILRTITWDGYPAGAGQFPVTLRLPAGWPDWDTGGETGDRGCSVIDDDGVIHEFYHFNKTSWTAALHKTHPVTGLGHGTALNDRLGTHAAGTAGLFGIMRKAELLATGVPIRHCHGIAVPRSVDQNHPLFLSPYLQIPATGTDTGAGTGNKGVLKYGSLIAIPPVSAGGPDLDALLAATTISEPWYRVMVSARDYGVFLNDGAQSPVFRTDDRLGEPLKTQVQTGFRTQFWQYVRLVDNAVTGATALMNSSNVLTGDPGTLVWPAGGGTPLAANSALI